MKEVCVTVGWHLIIQGVSDETGVPLSHRVRVRGFIDRGVIESGCQRVRGIIESWLSVSLGWVLVWGDRILGSGVSLRQGCHWISDVIELGYHWSKESPSHGCVRIVIESGRSVSQECHWVRGEHGVGDATELINTKIIFDLPCIIQQYTAIRHGFPLHNNSAVSCDLHLYNMMAKYYFPLYYTQRWADRYFGPLVRCPLSSGLPKW